MYSSSRGVSGVISCAHGAFTVGKSIYKNPGTTQRIGSITQRALSATTDASFIELSSGNSYTPYGSALVDSISPNVPVVGSYVTLRGGVSGTTSAKVLGTNASVTVDNDGQYINATNQIEVNRAVSYGDSGGGALSGTMDGGRTNCVVGIIRAGDNYGTFLVKGSYVLDAFR